MQVLVLGAGVIGVAVADALATRGADVTVLDMRAPGRGASFASAGILAPYTEAHPDSPLLRLGVRSLSRFDPFIADVSSRSGVHIEYARSGTLQVAVNDEEILALRAAKDWLDAIQVTADFVEGDAIAGLEPTLAPGVRAALLIRSHGYVGVASLVRALTLSARQAGAVFESPVEAVEITTRPYDLVVRANGRPYTADHVVVATGSWSGRLKIDDESPWPVRPVRGQLLELGWPRDRPLPERVVWGADCYCVPWSNGSLLVGATVEEVDFDERSTVAGVAALSSAVASLLPVAREASVDEVRVGLRPATPDGLPMIGALRDSPRVIAATGHFRNGILLAPITAEIVAHAVLDKALDESSAATSPDRFA